MRKAGGLIVMLLLVLAGCGKKDDSPGGMASGTGGALGTGGAIGSGGNTGSGGAPGTGGQPVAGMGASGMGAPGTGGMGTPTAPIPGCEAADPTKTGSAAHAEALAVLTPMTPCALSACHGGMGQAKLVLAGVTDLKATLVDKPACEAPMLKLVDSQGGDAALANSWLWQKLTAPWMSTDALIVQASWGTAAVCPTVGFLGGMTMGFGDHMPYGSIDPLGAMSLAKVRNWICSGASGP